MAQPLGPATPPPCPTVMPTQNMAPASVGLMLSALLFWPWHFARSRTRQRGGVTTAPTRLSPQVPGQRGLWARRWIFLMAVIGTTAPAGLRLWSVLRVDGMSRSEWVFLVTFVVLFAWITASFWMACLGGYAVWRRQRRPTSALQAAPSSRRRSRTAIVMPVYNEDAVRVFAALRAMHESLAESGAEDPFDFFVLSDSNRTACLNEEQVQWRQTRRALPDMRLFYRRRADNAHRKSGNIADFCEKWGALYDYMIILDADSLMSGSTLQRLVQLMNQHPRTALIQVPPTLVGRESLFARLQQFASSVYGPVFATGLSLLQGPDGNYWGHNAIIRTHAFVQHCGLPVLPGRGPLSGDIMSHDFVEAALLRRAGWDVWMAPELGGSYEEPPPTLSDHLKRDRRWCHGNLQHLRLILARGLRLPSRLHFAYGVMNYLSSPLWAIMLVASAVVAHDLDAMPLVTYVGRHPALTLPETHTWELVLLVAVTALLLFGPKLLAYTLTVAPTASRSAHGGRRKAATSLLLELLYSTLTAPVVMVSHSLYVASVLLGVGSSWGTQQRTERRVGWARTARDFALHTFVGTAGGWAVYHYIPNLFWWYFPLTLGLVLSIPLAMLSSDPRVGRWAGQRALFLTPAQTRGLGILQRTQTLQGLAAHPVEDARVIPSPRSPSSPTHHPSPFAWGVSSHDPSTA